MGAVVAHDVRRALHKRKDYRLLQIHLALNAGDEVEAQNDIKTAQEFHEAGQSAFENGDVEDAAEQFETAARLMEKSFAALTDITEYRALLLRLGEARLAGGDDEGANESFERAAIFRVRGWEAPLGPDALNALEQARQGVADRETGAIAVETDPAHAEIWVNGRYSGISPVTVTMLPVGEHVITVAKAGFARVTSTARAADDTLRNAEIMLQPARRKLLYDQLVEQLTGELQRLDLSVALPGSDTKGGRHRVVSAKGLGSLLLGDVGVVVKTTRSETQTFGEENARVDLYLFDPLARRLLHRVHTTLDLSVRPKQEMADLVDALLDIDYGVALGGSPTDPTESYDGPLTRKWWFWTAIGVGTLGAVATAIVATREEPPPAPSTGSMVVRF